jgi:hypothetical protein
LSRATSRTAGPILKVNGLFDLDFAKAVPFGNGEKNENDNLMIKFTQNWKNPHHRTGIKMLNNF